MNPRKSASPQKKDPSGPSHARVTILLTAVYFAILISLISYTLFVEGEFSVSESEGVRYPGDWIKLLQFTYYGLPFVVGIIYGFVFTPFWKSCRNIVIAVFAIHLLYSFAANALRYRELESWRADIKQSHAGRVQSGTLKHRLRDTNNDGFIDTADFTATVDVAPLALGHYRIYFILSQDDQPIPWKPVGSFNITVKPEGNNIRRFDFKFNPQPLDDYFQNGAVDVDMHISRSMEIPQRMRDVIFINRWAAFFRGVSWEGEDKYLNDREIEIQVVKRAGSFHMLPFKLKHQQVSIRSIGLDFAQDINENGLYDQVVVPLDIDSLHEGDIYVTALLNGRKDVRVTKRQEVFKGANRFQFIIDGADILKLDTDGPFTLEEFSISNENPACAYRPCPKRIKPLFKEKFQKYQTEYYPKNRFE